jgi:hypothetical protein
MNQSLLMRMKRRMKMTMVMKSLMSVREYPILSVPRLMRNPVPSEVAPEGVVPGAEPRLRWYVHGLLFPPHLASRLEPLLSEGVSSVLTVTASPEVGS